MRDRYYSKDRSVYAEMEYTREHDGKTMFYVTYDGWWGKREFHEIKLYEWAKHLHGNAPAGTPYGYFNASRNGKRVIITV